MPPFGLTLTPLDHWQFKLHLTRVFLDWTVVQFSNLWSSCCEEPVLHYCISELAHISNALSGTIIICIIGLLYEFRPNFDFFVIFMEH